jgi:hypothetical protein
VLRTRRLLSGVPLDPCALAVSAHYQTSRSPGARGHREDDGKVLQVVTDLDLCAPDSYLARTRVQQPKKAGKARQEDETTRARGDRKHRQFRHDRAAGIVGQRESHRIPEASIEVNRRNGHNCDPVWLDQASRSRDRVIQVTRFRPALLVDSQANRTKAGPQWSCPFVDALAIQFERLGREH